MAVGREARLKYLAVKAVHMGPSLIKNPRLALIGARGVHLASFLSLQASWIRNAGISTVIDIGANAGQFSSAIHEVLPNARIYAFEPLPTCYRELTRHFASVPTFQAFEVALGEESAKIPFHQNGFAESSSPLVMARLHEEAFPWTARTTEIEVDVRPLDSFRSQMELTERVLVKIDVQGFEDRVLRGGKQVIEAADYVFVETSFAPLYEDQASFECVHDLMIDYGFRLAGFMDQLEDSKDGRILQGDAIFVRRPITS